MKQYNFTESGINTMYDSVCDESMEKVSNIMEEINSSPIQITEEQNTRFQKVYDSIAINITIGSHTITIPNNADNVELIFNTITECRKQTI